MAPPNDRNGGPTDDDLIRLGKLLERARRDVGLSAREVADNAGISPAYLRAIERGSNPKTQRPSRPSPDALRGIAETIGAEAAQVLLLAGYDPALAEGPPGRGAPARGAVDDLVREIHDAAKGLNKRSPFMYARTLERLKRLTADFRLMSEGTLKCDSEEEPHLTRLAVLQCESHLRAVSYQDETWWRSDAGDRYLELHESLSARNVEMTRIFICSKRIAGELLPTFERHVALGIQTYILSPDEVNDYYWRDFVIYDNTLLREADSTDPSNDRKLAEFTDDPSRIARARDDFDALLSMAQSMFADAEHVLSRIAAAEPAPNANRSSGAAQ